MRSVLDSERGSGQLLINFATLGISQKRCGHAVYLLSKRINTTYAIFSLLALPFLSCPVLIWSSILLSKAIKKKKSFLQDYPLQSAVLELFFVK